MIDFFVSKIIFLSSTLAGLYFFKVKNLNKIENILHMYIVKADFAVDEIGLVAKRTTTNKLTTDIVPYIKNTFCQILRLNFI